MKKIAAWVMVLATLGTVVQGHAAGEARVVLDLDAGAGDQGRRTAIGENATVDVVATEGLSGAAGYRVTIELDRPAAVSRVSGAGAFSSAHTIVKGQGDAIEVVGVLLNGVVQADSGSLFRVELALQDSDSLVIRATSVVLGSALDLREADLPEEVLLVRPRPEDVAAVDFDGDGAVGFGDFLLFAAAFGTRETDDGFVAAFDLDGDGETGFTDFLEFASLFGQQVQ